MPRNAHNKPAPAGEQFGRPVWDAIRDLETEYKVYIHLDITMTGQKGVWEIRCLAYDETAPKEHRPICSCARDWPSSQVVSLPGMVFAVVNGMAVTIRDHMMDKLMREKQQVWPDERGGKVR